MKKLLNTSIWLVIISLLFACNKDEGPYILGEVDVSDIDTVSFSEHIQPIFDANCISCHNTSHAKLNLQPTVSYKELLTSGFSASYVNTSNPERSNLYLHLTGGLAVMPPSGLLSSRNQELVFKWIDQGAIDN